MRIRRLDLVRFGHFTDLRLDFPSAEPDLHIVVGPNEAGKSTVLEALEDLLFGIKARSRMDFLHPYPKMLLGAVLEGNGSALEFLRRKGNKNTVLAPSRVPLATGERALAPFVGSADRGFFKRMFDLDHEWLRRGGKEILEDRNEIGQMLFAAGSGVQNLRGKLSRLDREADRLWAPRRSAKRNFYQSDDRLKAAERERREHTVTAAKWRELRRTYEKWRDDHTERVQSVEEEEAELHKLERIRRVAADVRRKRELDRELAELGNIAELPPNAREVLRSAEEEMRQAGKRLDEQKADADILRKDHEALVWDDALLVRAEEIDLLHTQRIEVQNEQGDLPKREKELYSLEGNVHELAAELGWEAEHVDAIVMRIPNRGKVNRARGLFKQRGTRVASVERATVALAESRRRLSDCMIRIEEAGEAKDVTTLSSVVAATNREYGEIGSRTRSAEYLAREAATEADRFFSELIPRPATIAAAVSLKAPAAGWVESYCADRRALDQQLRASKQQIRDRQRTIRLKTSERDRFVADNQPVSPEQVRALREQRDALWSDIRKRLLEDEGQSGAGALDPAFETVPMEYEALVAKADRAADRKFETAEAVARLAQLNQSIARDQDALDELHQEHEHHSESSSSLDAEWRSRWQHAPFEPLGPDEMLRWLAKRSSLRDSVNSRSKAEREAATLRRHEREATHGLRAELQRLGVSKIPAAEKGLLAVIDFAADIVRTHQQAGRTRRRLATELRKAKSEVAQKRDALSRADHERSAWQTKWSLAVSDLGLDPDEDPNLIDDQLQSIQRLRNLAEKMKDLRENRVEKIRRDIRDFRNAAARTLQSLAPDLTSADGFVAVPELEIRLETARQKRKEAQALDRRIGAVEAKIRGLRKEKRRARDTITGLQDQAGTESIDALKSEIERADRFHQRESERSIVIKRLAQQSDGLSLEQLESECASADLDAVAAHQTSLRDKVADLRNQQMEARDRLNEARTNYKRVGGGDAAAIAESGRQGALAEIGEVAEAYVRTRAAALLLQWAIDRNRREKQGPMLKRAGAVFADLTLGSFESLELDYDLKDRPLLVGRRPSGERVGIEGMSDGSLDQLYLALRVAALENYFKDAEPLPFLADDLFINFDNDRAAAGFRVLAGLAESCQVIFFTHHEHLVELAQFALPYPAPVLRMEH